MEAHDWDARYGEAELLWGAKPNTFVAAELSAAKPGRALDVACGEGRNAIWLASQGWHVIGIDFSAQGLKRAEQLASGAGVADRVEFQLGDVVSDALPAKAFDAVVIAYLHLPAGARRDALRNAATAVANGGTLLIVGHDSTNLTEGTGGPQDAAVLFSPEDVIDDLAELTDFVVEKAERVHRLVSGTDRRAVDALVRLRRETPAVDSHK